MKLFFFVVLNLFPLLSVAQTFQILRKPIPCSSFEIMVDLLQNEHKEKLIWQSKSSTGTTIIFMMNEQKGNWTIVETNGEMACALAEGENKENIKLPVKPLTS